jgi:transcriptional regulator with XRE-family HTH domain
VSAKWVHMPTTPAPEPFGRRLAALRARFGLTQQEVAYRLAMSRNAVSHVETGGSIPSERTIVLLAGLFAVAPHELVAGTDYPVAKADRLPLVAAAHTEVSARLLALDAELRWIAQMARPDRAEALAVVGHELQVLERTTLEPAEQVRVREALVRLRSFDVAAGVDAAETA